MSSTSIKHVEELYQKFRESDPKLSSSRICEIVKSFENQMKRVEHQHCEYCHCVSLFITLSKVKQKMICSKCKSKHKHLDKPDLSLPIWFDENKNIRYELPKKLCGLREAEKLLIARVSAYVPLLHLRKGQIGMKGHICSFLQVSSI